MSPDEYKEKYGMSPLMGVFEGCLSLLFFVAAISIFAALWLLTRKD